MRSYARRALRDLPGRGKPAYGTKVPRTRERTGLTARQGLWVLAHVGGLSLCSLRLPVCRAFEKLAKVLL